MKKSETLFNLYFFDRTIKKNKDCSDSEPKNCIPRRPCICNTIAAADKMSGCADLKVDLCANKEGPSWKTPNKSLAGV